MKLARILPVAGFVLLLAVAVGLAEMADRERAMSLAEDAHARAQLVAQGLAKRVERAAALGIPLAELRGVDQLFDEQIATYLDITAISLIDSKANVLVNRVQPGTIAQVEITVPVNLGDGLASITVGRTSADAAIFTHWVLALAAVGAVFAVLAGEALRAALVRGPWRREGVIAQACDALASGDFTRRMPLLERHDYDLRAQWLAAQLRQVHERQLRIRRLVASLRKTEPDAQRRAELDDMIVRATGSDRFSDGALDVRPPDPALAVRSRALGVAFGVVAWLPGAWVVALTPAMPPSLAECAGALAVTLFGSLLVRRRLRSRSLDARSFLVGAGFALAVCGPGLLGGWALITDPDALWPWTLGGTVLWISVLTACCAWLAADLLRGRARAPRPEAAAAFTEPVHAA